MKLRWFLTVLAIIGLVASVFYASSISVPLNTPGAFTGSQTGMSNFVQLLRNQGYSVSIANTTQQEQSFASDSGTVFFLISPDKPISSSFAKTLYSGYKNGSLSLVMAEDNITNEASLLSDFGASVTGASINDTASSFTDQRIFNVDLKLGAVTGGQMDIASPIILKGSPLTPVAQSSQRSIDSQNSTMGPRTVIAASSSASNARAILISSFSPFTNCGLSKCSNLNDTSLVLSIANWASGGNTSRPIVIDGSKYASAIPPIHFGVPVGTIMLFVLEGFLNRLGGYGISSLTSPSGGLGFLGQLVPNSLIIFIQLIVAIVVLLFIRNRIKAWFAREKSVKDDQPLPVIEKEVVSQSKERIDFVTMSRNKSFYVATLAQLYEAIDDVAKLELGFDVRELTVATLTSRLGTEKATLAYKNLQELSKYFDFANNKGRIFFPPGLSWKRKVRNMTRWAEEFLNDLGLTMSGKEGGRQMEYALKR